MIIQLDLMPLPVIRGVVCSLFAIMGLVRESCRAKRFFTPAGDPRILWRGSYVAFYVSMVPYHTNGSEPHNTGLSLSAP